MTHARNRGFILIMVLALLALLTVLLLTVHQQAMRALADATARPAARQARQNALSGCDIAIAALKHNPNLPADPSGGYRPNSELTLPSGSCTLLIEDESGKIPINALKSNTGLLDHFRIGQLLRLADRINAAAGAPLVSYAFIPCLIDWTDPDQEKTVLPFIATDNTGWDPLDTTGPGAPCGNRPLQVIAELTHIKGITPAFYQGQFESPGGSFAFPGLASLLTVQPNTKLNVNTANYWVLLTLDEELTDRQVRAILDYRQFKPFGSLEEFRTVAGLSAGRFAGLATWLTLKPESRCYRIVSTGQATGDRCRIEMTVKLKPGPGTFAILDYKETGSIGR